MPVFDNIFKSDPFPFYDELRSTGPLARVRLPTGVDCWLLVDHGLVRSFAHDRRLSKDSRFAGADWHAAHLNRSGGTSRPFLEHLLTVDEPQHTRLRALVSPDFRPARIAALRPVVESVVQQALDRLEPGALIDFVAEFAAPVPLGVICELLGVPRADQRRFRHWARLLVAAGDHEQALIPGAVQELSDYLLSLAETRRAAPDDSLFCRLVRAVDEGRMTERELTAMGFIILVAGHETTAALLSTGLLAMLESPVVWNRLCDEPDGAPRLVEELIRLCSPVEVATPRFAREDIVVGPHTIEKGDSVFLGLAAANRDGACFSRPHELSPERTGSGHLAFGLGPHFCLGAGLARLETEVAFTAFARRFPGVRVEADRGTLEWSRGLLLRGLTALPVRLHKTRGQV